MKLAIIGSRQLNPVINLDIKPALIVSGGAKGVDNCAKDYAIKNKIGLKIFLPNYDKYGKVAPIIRNKEIVDFSDEVLAYWDGKSKGTKMVIDYCTKKGKKVKIIYAN